MQPTAPSRQAHHPQPLEAERRERAHLAGQPQPLTHYAPTLPPVLPIALASEGDSMHVDDCGQASLVETTNLADHLAEQVGVDATAATHRTLVLDSPRTLIEVRRLAARLDRQHPAGPVLAWWLDRLDHPGTGAALIATEALRRRWVTGATRQDEDDPAVWARWLGRSADGCPASLAADLAHAASDGHTLPGLLDLHVSDRYSWQRMQRTASRWTGPDSRRDAALGLLSRNQATELYDSLLLDDPLYAQDAQHTGHILTGEVEHTDTGSIVVHCSSPLTRLRAGDHASGWIGPPHAADTGDRFTTQIRSLEVTPAGGLRVTCAPLTKTCPTDGERVTLRPRRIDPMQQVRLRTQVSHRLRGCWLLNPQTPAAGRRDVPMDVVIAAAETD